MAQRIYLGIVGASFIASGLFAFVNPHAVGAFLGIAPVDAAGLTEIRATYGGLMTGIGLLLACGLRSGRLALAALACTVFGVGGLVLTRLAMEVFSGEPGIAANQGIIIAFELPAVGLAVFFLRRALAEGRRPGSCSP